MEIRDTDFEEIVLQSDRPVLVDFWASWCPPCKMMQPVVEKLAGKVSEWADVYSMNIDRSSSVAALYQVNGVPTFIAFADGQLIDRKTGALTEGQMLSLLKKAEEAMPPDAESETPSELADLNVGDRTYITVVSGLPRSGTSMMMRMLEAGGIPALTDGTRVPDENNPNGYYEFEGVKHLEEDSSWIQMAHGRSVKMVYSLLKHLPSDHEYRVLFMRRNLNEILQSQKEMLRRGDVETDVPDSTMKALLERELRQFYAWVPTQPHLHLVNVNYNDLLTHPRATIARIDNHFDGTLDIDAMAAIVDPELYRNRAA